MPSILVTTIVCLLLFSGATMAIEPGPVLGPDPDSLSGAKAASPRDTAGEDSTGDSWNWLDHLRPLPRDAAPSRRRPDRRDGWYEPDDSTTQDSLPSDSLVELRVRRHPLLTKLLFPVDKFIRPAVNFTIRPVKTPILYADSGDLVPRSIDLVNIGTTGRERMLYPTFKTDGGPGTSTGLTYIENGFLGRSELSLRGSALVGVRETFMASVRLATRKPVLWGFGGGLYYRLSRNSETAVWVPGERSMPRRTTPPGLVEEEYDQFEMSLSHRVWGGSLSGAYRQVNWDIGPPFRAINRLPDSLSWLADGDHGTEGLERDHVFQVAWGRDDRDRQGVPTAGGGIAYTGTYILARGGGDAFRGTFQASRFFLLGEEKYVYRKSDIEPFLKLDPTAIIGLLDPSKLQKRLTQRKILAWQLRIEQMIPLEEDEPVSYFNYPALGGGAPARGYSGRRLLDEFAIGTAVEYRWPIWRYIDGAVFSELACAAPAAWRLAVERWAPSAGIGLRVRTPSQFLFRVQLGFGLGSVQTIATTSPEF